MKRTEQTKICDALLKRGAIELPPTRKYRVFKWPEKENFCLFVGRNGGFRSGRNQSTSVSILGSNFHKGLIADES